MIVPDTNLLVFAYDELSRFHDTASSWWEETLSNPVPVGLPSIVLLAFVRLTTHTALIQNPMTINQAEEIVSAWLRIDHVQILSPSGATFVLFFQLLSLLGSGGNLTTDAMIAALATEFGGTVYSNDRDFGRFPDLLWRNPLE